MTYPKPCRNCARMLRPGGTTQEDYPTSEIPHQAKGLCGACYRTPNRVPIEYPRPCGACNRLMHPRKAPPQKYPDAEIGHQAHGYCSTCYLHHYHYNKFPSPKMIEEQARLEGLRHANNVAGLNRFMQRIRGKSKVRL